MPLASNYFQKQNNTAPDNTTTNTGPLLTPIQTFTIQNSVPASSIILGKGLGLFLAEPAMEAEKKANAPAPK